MWSTVFASLGAGARGLLTSGVDFDAALAEVSKDAGQITQNVLIAAAVLGVAALLVSRLPPAVPMPGDSQSSLGEGLSEGLDKLSKKLSLDDREKVGK